MPAAQVAFGREFERLHPDWETRLWTDADLDELEVTEGERARARSASELSNLVRYEVLRRHGGVYLDTDVEGRRPFDDLLAGVRAFAALELPGRVGTAVLGACRGTGRSSARRGCHATRSGWGCTLPTRTGPT